MLYFRVSLLSKKNLKAFSRYYQIDQADQQQAINHIFKTQKNDKQGSKRNEPGSDN